MVAENHIGREYAWVVDGVARTKSILRYPAPGAGYGVDIDENKEQSQRLQAKFKAALAERAAEPKRDPLTAAQWDGEAKNASAAAYLAYVLQAHQGDDGWIHPGTLNYLHEQIVKRLTANPVDPQAGALHACRRSMERSGHLKSSEVGALLDRVATVDEALLAAAQGRESWLNMKFGGPRQRERPKPPQAKQPGLQSSGEERGK